MSVFTGQSDETQVTKMTEKETPISQENQERTESKKPNANTYDGGGDGPLCPRLWTGH